MEISNYYIEAIDHKNIKQVMAVSNLHLKLVPESKPSRLGNFFLRKFYFNTLIKYGYLRGLTFRIKNNYVGFTLFTESPDNFMYKAIWQDPINYIIIILFLLATRPITLTQIFINNISFINNYKKKKERVYKEQIKIGHWLSFGVQEKYLKCITKDGLRISNYLVMSMIKWFKKNDYALLIGSVRKKNIPAILLYNSMGYIMEKSDLVEKEFYFFSINLENE